MSETQNPLSRALTAEALGSFLLAATVIGSGIMGAQLAAGNDAVALLGNTLATAAMLAVLISLLAPLSGAHFNPAVTLCATLDRSLSPAWACLYLSVQIAAMCAGAVFAHAMFDLPLLQLGDTARTGTGQYLSEFAAAFALILTIWGAQHIRPQSTPILVAAVIAAGYWWTASTSFANPAITLARSLTGTFAGIRPEDAPAFILAQTAGALLAFALARLLFRKPI